MKFRICLLTLLLLHEIPAWSAIEKAGLKAAIAQGMVTIKATGSGNSYMEKGIRIQVHNKAGKALQLTVEPGLIFTPADTSFQDLVLPGENVITLAKNGETVIDLQSFCAKSYAKAPGRASVFHLSRQADSAMIKTLGFINKYRLFNTLGQQAVWVLTNDKSLSSIYDPAQPEVSEKLLALLMELTHKPAPDYYKQYKLSTIAGEPVLQMRVLKIYSVFEWQLSTAQDLTIGIYNEQNRLVQSVIYNKEFKRGRYKLTVTFEANDVAAGTYFIRLKNKARTLKEQQVVVE